MKYQHIMWDWNGTLLDDLWLCVDTINVLLQKYDKPPLTTEGYLQVFDFPVKEYYKKIGFNFDETPFETVGTEFIDMYRNRWREASLHDGVVETLQFCADHDIKQSIISAADSAILNESIQHFGLTPYFERLNGLDHHYATSKLEIAKDYVNSLEVSPVDILLVGDTTHDFHVADAIGVSCILFSGGHHPVNKLRACRVPVVDRLDAIRQYL